MPLAEATALAGPLARSQTRPGRGGADYSPRRTALHLEPYDGPADREALEKLAVCCRRFSPLVGIEDSPAPDSLLLDVTGLEHLFGGEASLATGVVDELTRRGLAVRVAIADTIGAAWAVAHFGRKRKAESGKRKVESGKGKAERGKRKAESGKWKVEGSGFGVQGSGFPCREFSDLSNRPLPPAFRFPLSAFVVRPGETSVALRPLPVEALRLPGDVVELLHQLGIYQIGQLELLPRADFASRFGPRLLERLDQATGRLAEPLPTHQPPPLLEAPCSLEHPTARRAAIELVLEQLIRRVAQMLVRSGRGAVELQCRLECGSAGCVDLSVGFFQATASAGHMFGLVQTRLERVSLPGSVSAVRVQVTCTAPLPRRQEELFSDAPRREDPRQVAGLVDRLSSRLGRRSVVRARLVHDAQPEWAYRYEPLVGDPSGRRARRGSSSRVRWTELPPRPLRLMRRPIPLAIVSIMPDGPPLRFHFNARQHRIAQVWGPERIETGWWRGHAIGRDYYRIETTTGRRFWLFRRLRDGRWFLHGTFE